MNYYFAPMEGITGFVFRNAHHRYFPGVDKYFSPFIAPNQNRSFSPRELRDVLPEHNEGLTMVPQILTNKSEDFIKAAQELKSMGYHEVNLNLGCPSKTVVTKGRGSGFLADPEKLNHFLDEIFTRLDMKLSVKTRIGRDHPEEWETLMDLYNRFPMEELIVHPRIQQDYYKNTPNLTVFGSALAASRNNVCYNGDIFTAADYRELTTAFPDIQSVMLGRGLIANPGLVGVIENDSTCSINKADLRAFHDEIYQGYAEYMSGDRDVLFRMKELWFYLSCMFTNSDSYLKKIRKSSQASEYKNVVDSLFHEQEILEQAGFHIS